MKTHRRELLIGEGGTILSDNRQDNKASGFSPIDPFDSVTVVYE